MLDLAKFAEDDDDDEEEEEYQTDLRRNQRRAEWAKGKTRAQPSENWDDDFLFGAASAESLPLPPKSSDLTSTSHKKPGSSQSIRPSSVNPRSSHHQSHSSHHRSSKPSQQQQHHHQLHLTEQQLQQLHLTEQQQQQQQQQRKQQQQKQQQKENQLFPTPLHSEPTLTLRLDQDSLTPRKRKPINHTKKAPSSPSPSPPPPNTISDTFQSLYPFSTTSSPASSIRATALPSPPSPLSRPPSSAPPSRAQSAQNQSPNQSTSQRRVSPHDHHIFLHSNNPKHSSHSSNPSVSLTRRPWTPLEAISSQDSVPSISDLSSTGFRSPSSSLSMTDDGRWDWSHSSGDGINHLHGTASGNLSFNTETEFTEPDTELEWADTDHEHHSSRVLTSKKTQQKTRSHQHTSHPHPLSSPLLNRPTGSSLVQPAHYRLPSQSLQLSESYGSTAASEIDHFVYPSQPISLENNHLPHKPAPLSIDSQATFISSQSRKPYLNNNHPAPSSSATSSTSSLGSFKPRYSVSSSIHSSTQYANQYAYNNSAQISESYIPPHQVRTPSSGSTFSNKFGYYHSGSESYDATASSTENDVTSDHFAGDDSHQSIPSPISSHNNRNTPIVSQRSRKQALYSRPPYVDPSPGGSLVASVSSSTLNASEVDLDPQFAGMSVNDPNNHNSNRRVGEDEKPVKNQLRRRIRKKRPSTLLLNKTVGLSSGFESPTSIISHNASATESVFHHESAHPGDLAFAADSEDEERRSRTFRQPTLPTEPTRKLSLARMNLYSRTPTRINGSSHRASNATSPTTLTRSHQTLDQTKAGKTLPPPSTTSEESNGKKFQPRRPLSFTTLFSRGSVSSHASSFAQHTNSQNTVNQSSNNRIVHRHSTSIDSNIRPFASSPHSHTSNEGLLSRVRRLSSRPPLAKNDVPSGLVRKRFSIVGDTVSGMPCLATAPNKPSGTLMKPNRGITNRFSTALKSNRRQISQSESIVSDMTLSAGDHQSTVRARRPSSRSSQISSSNADDVKPGITLTRKFSARSNNKCSVHQPDLCHSPTDNIDHNLTFAPSVQVAPRMLSRKTLPSRPPKSNPALRAKAEANAQFIGYHINQDRTFYQRGITPKASDPASNLDVGSSPVIFHNSFVRNSSNPVPNSEPMLSQDLSFEHDPPACNHLVHLSNMNAPLARSNSMGELRIPSRITMQQGRLQTELNQVKEFARGIEELKSMRRTYRKMIRSTHRSRIDPNFVTTDESDTNSTDSDNQKDLDPLPDQSEEKLVIKPHQVSPRALDRLYTIIQKIQEEYKEWWTCCNVLIDLGEGKTDPRAKFSPERIRSITSHSDQPAERTSSPILQVTVASPEAEPKSQKHFEILKSMFGPSGEPTNAPHDSEGNAVFSSSPNKPTPEKEPLCCQTPPMVSTQEVEACEKTPRSRPLVKADNPSQLPPTPTPASRKASQLGRMPQNESSSSIDWSESESSWSGIDIVKDEIKSAPVKQQVDKSVTGKLESGAIKEKSKPHLPGRYSSYLNNHNDRVVNFDPGATRPRLSPGNRIGISGIKDFLRVLKARVNAEEKWPTRKKGSVVNNVVGLKRRSISSNLYSTIKGASHQNTAEISQNVIENEKKSPSMTIISLNQQSKEKIELGGSVEGTIQNENSIETTTTSSSSEEECWDELFGFKDNNNITTMTGTTESLDLALPIEQQHKKKLLSGSNSNSTVIGEGGRLALSSERMPQLLNYLSIVKEQCKECLVELKSQTV